MRNIMMLTSVALVAFSTSAIAADTNPFIAPAPDASVVLNDISWDGAYFGVDVGYGDTDWKISALTASVGDNVEGLNIGAFGGYNWELYSGFIVGLEGNISYDFNNEDYFLIGPFEIGTKESYSVRARTGYAVDNTFFFVAGGWTSTKGEYKEPGYKDSERLSGMTLGAGVDYAVSNDVFVRAEYKFNNYGSQNVDNYFDIPARISLDQHMIKVGVGMKF